MVSPTLLTKKNVDIKSKNKFQWLRWSEIKVVRVKKRPIGSPSPQTKMVNKFRNLGANPKGLFLEAILK